ncbi:MAG: hypothetical protein AB7E60_13290 [Sphingobium sp.]
MIRLCLGVLIVWALGAWLLWGAMSRASGSVIDIGWRDRGIALFWLPLAVVLAAWSALSWACDWGRGL